MKLLVTHEGAEVLFQVLQHFAELPNHWSQYGDVDTSNNVVTGTDSVSNTTTESGKIGRILFEDQKNHIHPALISLTGLAVGIPLTLYFSVRFRRG